MTGDCLIVGYDYSSDGNALTIAREENGRVRVLNTIQGDVAFAVYHLLVGNGIIKENKTAEEIMFQLKCIKEHLKFISQTTDKSVDFDIKVLDGCISQIETQILKK
ncbi:MAG: hypothetical protein PUC23_03540 [bacterium]|nr:hypothetical protein [bacterium]